MPHLDQWRQMWKELGAATCDDSLFHELIACYSEAHRRYHTPQHLDECLAKLQEVVSVAEHPREIELALWFHDAIYDVKRQDNEERSAEWAQSAVREAGLSVAAAARVRAMVMATRHNAVPEGADAQILIDIDLSILGAEAQRFDEYERQIREEYAWVPGILFRRERRKILEQIVERPRIFNTEHFFKTLEVRARGNLERSIRQLGG